MCGTGVGALEGEGLGRRAGRVVWTRRPLPRPTGRLPHGGRAAVPRSVRDAGGMSKLAGGIAATATGGLQRGCHTTGREAERRSMPYGSSMR